MNKENWNWNTFLNQKEEDISWNDWQLASNLSDMWPTCACGELCKGIPRLRHDGSPKDKILLNLGGSFCGYINGHDLENAKEIFRKIEKRTIELLKLKS